jgi:hypothetical protein
MSENKKMEYILTEKGRVYYMSFLGCMIIGVVLSFLISEMVRGFSFERFVFKNRYKYYFVSISISVFVGVLIFLLFDNSTNVLVAGFLWGLIDGILKTTITLEKE